MPYEAKIKNIKIYSHIRFKIHNFESINYRPENGKVLENMGIITLISDWGLNDYYAAAVKGMIIKSVPDARIVEISHQIKTFDIEQAAYILKNAYRSFPDGTVHIIGVNTEESVSHPHTVALYNNHYFIGTDNGVFSLIFDDPPEKLIILDILQDTENFTFSGRDRFVKAAVHLVNGGKIEELGSEKAEMEKKILFEPVVNQDSIRGIVAHIDTYQNLITNIPKKLFIEKTKGRKFTISLRSANVNKISDSYGDVPNGEVVALFSSNGMLEIAMNKSKASSLLGIKRKFPVIIELE